MTTFVLVHGAWHGSWCWKRVRKALQAEGHDVFTPTLTGVAERSHLISPQVNLDTHVADVVNLIRWEELTDVVLCGHSYGGCVITGVADRIPERLRALVYLDAFILGERPGAARRVAARGRRRAGPRRRRDRRRLARAADHARSSSTSIVDGSRVGRPPMHAATARDVPATAARRRNSFPAAKCTHILATGYEHSPFPPFHEIAKTKGWKTLTIDCGHDVMLDRPNELVAMLRDAAR